MNLSGYGAEEEENVNFQTDLLQLESLDVLEGELDQQLISVSTQTINRQEQQDETFVWNVNSIFGLLDCQETSCPIFHIQSGLR